MYAYKRRAKMKSRKRKTVRKELEDRARLLKEIDDEIELTVPVFTEEDDYDIHDCSCSNS